MSQLKELINILTGHFDNREQFEKIKAKQPEFPYAQHVNTPCNDKIRNLPEQFEGCFMVEESYYTVNGRTQASPHLFLFSPKGEGVELTSYDLPATVDKKNMTYASLPMLDYNELQPSAKFTPALYLKKDGIWEGGSVSMFTPVLKFTLFERFSYKVLEVSETMEVNGKRTFGYDDAILYKRTD